MIDNYLNCSKNRMNQKFNIKYNIKILISKDHIINKNKNTRRRNEDKINIKKKSGKKRNKIHGAM
jgi:hypothetical protein